MAGKKQGATTPESNEPKRNINVVVLDARFKDPNGRWSLAEVLLQLFAYTPAVTLRLRPTDAPERSTVKYQAGDYVESAPNVWTGRIEMIRETKTHSVKTDSEGRYVFTDADSQAVTTAETRSFFAYHELRGLIVYRDQNSMPYTRLISYVQSALSKAVEAQDLPDDLEVDIRPRIVQRTVREWFDTFTAVSTLSLTYGHSRSPGNKSVDLMIDAFNAKEIRETVVAKSGEDLNTDTLLDTKHDIGRAIDHLEKNPRNGVGKIHGAIDGQRFAVTTRKAAERHRVQTVFTRRGLLAALVNLVKTVPQNEAPDDTDK